MSEAKASWHKGKEMQKEDGQQKCEEDEERERSHPLQHGHLSMVLEYQWYYSCGHVHAICYLQTYTNVVTYSYATKVHMYCTPWYYTCTRYTVYLVCNIVIIINWYTCT